MNLVFMKTSETEVLNFAQIRYSTGFGSVSFPTLLLNSELEEPLLRKSEWFVFHVHSILGLSAADTAKNVLIIANREQQARGKRLYVIGTVNPQNHGTQLLENNAVLPFQSRFRYKLHYSKTSSFLFSKPLTFISFSMALITLVYEHLANISKLSLAATT